MIYDLHHQMNINNEITAEFLEAKCGAWQSNLKTENI